MGNTFHPGRRPRSIIRKNPLHVHTHMDAAFGQGKRQQLVTHVKPSHALQPSPTEPGKHGDREPRYRRKKEPKTARTRPSARSQRRKLQDQGSRGPPLPHPARQRPCRGELLRDLLFLFVAGNAFRSASRWREKSRGKPETARQRLVRSGRRSGLRYRHRPPKPTNRILVPACLTKRGGLELNDHVELKQGRIHQTPPRTRPQEPPASRSG